MYVYCVSDIVISEYEIILATNSHIHTKSIPYFHLNPIQLAIVYSFIYSLFPIHFFHEKTKLQPYTFSFFVDIDIHKEDITLHFCFRKFNSTSVQCELPLYDNIHTTASNWWQKWHTSDFSYFLQSNFKSNIINTQTHFD